MLRVRGKLNTLVHSLFFGRVITECTLAHPFSLAFARGSTALIRQLRHEWHAAQEHAETAITLLCEQAFP